MRFFHAAVWAKAFLNASGGKAHHATQFPAQEAFIALCEISTIVKLKSGAFFGRITSIKLEKVLRECAGINNEAIETAIRFLCLLIEKKSFCYIDPILEKIEQMINERNGIIDVTLESASSVDNSFEKQFEKNIIKMTNSKGAKIKKQINPKLLGGYLMRMKSFYIDASLKGQLEKMKDDLSDKHPALLMQRVGGNNV